MLFVGTSIIHPSTEGVFLLCNILDLLIYSFKNLYEPSAELTERLRPLQETETDDLMQKVTEEYNRTVKAIEDFQNA